MAFQPRSFINGKLVPNFLEKTVSLFVKIDGSCAGKSIEAQTTDQVPIQIILPEPLNENCTEYAEVIGVVSGPKTIKAKEVIFFEQSDQEFDCEGYNMLVDIMQNVTDFYKIE